LKYNSGKIYDKEQPIINKIELRLIDSFKFLSSSLDKLSRDLEKDKLIELAKYFPREHLNLLTKKLAYPYEYVDCLEKFEETQLLPIEKFYSSLINEHVNKEE
jgi:hypothetical protein